MYMYALLKNFKIAGQEYVLEVYHFTVKLMYRY